MMKVKGKNIIVGITGGIAAYKAAELVRLLVKEEAFTQVAMTKNATRFVAPLTFEALTGNPVIWDMWSHEGPEMEHIAWGQEADLVVIAPATAGFIARMAHGMADDFLSTMVLAATAKIMVCPSMNTRMYLNPAVQDNLARLKKRGITVMEPGEGQLACRTQGAGRLPEPAEILELAKILVTPPHLSGHKVLVTAGPTIEPLDPVRYLTNRSTGKMGYAVARIARQRGASVILISGPTALPPPYGVDFHPVKTAEQMQQAVFDHVFGCDMVIKAAAVSDYRPYETAPQKIKKGDDSVSLRLVKTPDILARLGESKRQTPCILVGFAAETETLLENATEKLRNKNLDMIVANDVSRKDAGFEAETNMVKFIYADGKTEESSLLSKDEVAGLVLDRALALMKGSSGS